MGVESGPKARLLAEALAALRRAANKPPYRQIVKHCELNGVEISDATVSDWLNGKSVPASAKSFEKVIRYLNGRAAKSNSGYECLSMLQWERLRTAALEERRGTQGERATPPDRGRRSDPRAVLITSLHAIQLREFIAPRGGLRDREQELELLTEFCHSDDQPYLWVQGEPWAGKSALLSTFALDPPPTLTVVSFFVADRRATQTDHTAYTAAVLDQLAILLPDHKPRIQAEVLNRDGLRSELLTIAARREAKEKRRLVLVVDGLDEDTGKPSIVGLLPALPDENLRIVVASRRGPSLPIPHGHPLATARRYPLTVSEFAAGLRERAVDELDTLLEGPERERELLALITVAHGLSVTELQSVTGTAPFEIDRLLRGRAGRSFRASTMPTEADGGGPDPVYALAHETLQRTAETRLGTRLLTASLNRLHTWAEQHHEQGWPNSTADFLLHRYFALVQRHDDLPRMAALAFNPSRHELIHLRTGADYAALNEIRIAHERLCRQPDPDLLTIARLARHRDDVHYRNNEVPAKLPAVRARLGQTDRAEGLALSISKPEHQLAALALLANEVAETDPSRAARIADHAETSIDNILPGRRQILARIYLAEGVADVDSDRAVRLIDKVFRDISDIKTESRDQVLARLVGVLAISDPDRAEALADGISDLAPWADALISVAEAVATADQVRAVRLADDAETIARDIPDTKEKATALIRLVVLVAENDPDQAIRLAEAAEATAGCISDPWARGDALAGLARGVAATDPDRATRLIDHLESNLRNSDSSWSRVDPRPHLAHAISRTDPIGAETIVSNISDLGLRAEELLGLAEAAATVDPAWAIRLVDDAEMIINEYSGTPKTQLYARVIGVVAGIDPDRALQLADNVEELVSYSRSIDSSGWTTAFDLIPLVRAVAGIDPARAARLADEIEALARDATDSWQADMFARLAEVVAVTNPTRAEALARDIPLLSKRVDALIRVIAELAVNNRGQALRLASDVEALVRNMPDLEARADVLTCLVEAVAGIDPARAVRLAHDAETIVRDIHDDLWWSADTLARLARMVTTSDPQRAVRLADDAEKIAHKIPDALYRAIALVAVAEVVAEIDLNAVKFPPIDSPDSESGNSSGRRRSKHLLALAWATGEWHIPITALATVDTPTLRALVNDLVGR
ncbi:hypothetical protein [Nocardia aurea]|uniref:Nephrocystin 3-like N-terminal domain-containing protein n=1 Tax=Nocardia aurea TaxID=2144174 RepID=A0ABV3G590_9NOCA